MYLDGFVLLQIVTTLLGLLSLVLITKNDYSSKLWGTFTGAVVSISNVIILLLMEAPILSLLSVAYATYYAYLGYKLYVYHEY